MLPGSSASPIFENHSKVVSKSKKEFGRFSLVGMAASAMDYGILNLLVGVFGLPVIGSNIASTSSSSYVSFMLNRKVVFKKQKYGTLRSMAMYALVIGFGILVLQSTVLYLLHNGEVLQGWIGSFIEDQAIVSLLSLNVAKAIATTAAGAWNFTMLQRVVFVSNDARKN